MKNIDVVQEFVNYGTDETIKTRNLWFEGDALFSYGRHFPICIRLKDSFIINSVGYSQTTSTHRGHIIRELTDCNDFKEFEKRKNKGEFEDIGIMNTSDMKELLDEHEDLRFITISELNK